ncbi:P-loop ATPase, Sll1717 family [Treponema sp. R80B11-R83G3]
MLKIDELELGSNDAEDYKRKDLKEFFKTVFCKNIYLDRLLTMNTFFLIGEKGTGKTAYAVFLSNDEYKETRSIIKYIRETQYQKFVNLKAEKHLLLSDYVSIWRVIILVLIASSIKKENILDLFSKSEKLERIKDAIDEYFNNAFSPEIATAMQIIENSKEIASLIFKAINYQEDDSKQLTFTETKFQTNLQFIERNLLNSIMSLKMKNNQFLFIDGIDIRPAGIDYKEYLSCVKGLAEAIWALNNDDFSVSNGSKGRFKVILLIRPDIFQSIGLQNSTNKIMNNSVYLDWRTTYNDYRNSELFTIGEKLLSYKQDCHREHGEIWDYYFNWAKPSTNERREFDTPFIQFLRISYSRPRDIVTIVQYMQRIQQQKRSGTEVFLPEIFESNEFKDAYSEYLMGGIKDQLAFYYTDTDYQLLMYFLSLFKNNSRFNYDFYVEKYKHFIDHVLKKINDNNLPEFIDTEEMFLQFLYETNIICYIDEGEREPLFRYCYRERNMSNLTPKVEFGKKYEFHYGLIKALNLASYK